MRASRDAILGVDVLTRRMLRTGSALASAALIGAVIATASSAGVEETGRNAAGGSIEHRSASVAVQTTPMKVANDPESSAPGCAGDGDSLVSQSGSANLTLGNERDPRHPSVHEVPAGLLPSGWDLLRACTGFVPVIRK